jgi:outer membrane protein TolC
MKKHFFGALLSVCSIISVNRPARAVEPLQVFVESARARSFDNREAMATLDQRSAEATAAWLKLVPVVTLTGSYVHNQYSSTLSIPNGPTATVLAENQGDFIASATLPIVDIGQWERIGAAKATLDSARSHAAATALDVEKAVTRDWYQLVAQEAVLEAARRTKDTSEKNLTYVSDRKEAGVGSQLDYSRAIAEVERNKQSVADAEYQVDTARIVLATASGHAPAPGGAVLVDDLTAEAPLGVWLATNLEALPSVRAELDDVRAWCGPANVSSSR